MGWPGDSAAMKLTKVVIAMGLLVGLTIAGHVAVREWYKPDVRPEQARQAQARRAASTCFPRRSGEGGTSSWPPGIEMIQSIRDRPDTVCAHGQPCPFAIVLLPSCANRARVERETTGHRAGVDCERLSTSRRRSTGSPTTFVYDPEICRTSASPRSWIAYAPALSSTWTRSM